jgi:hypothetical protein
VTPVINDFIYLNFLLKFHKCTVGDSKKAPVNNKKLMESGDNMRHSNEEVVSPEYITKMMETPMTGSFVHLHIGII